MWVGVKRGCGKYVIRKLDMYPNNILGIYDRDGRLVYNKSGYQNDWDGTFKGLQLQEDTFIISLSLMVEKVS